MKGTLAQHQDPAIWEFFADFCRWEMAVGGPDPHMATMIAMMPSESDPQARLWEGAAYVSVYNVPTAEAILREWTWQGARAGDVTGWLTEHWAGIVTRRERRAVRSPEKLGRCLQSLAGWVERVPGAPYYGPDPRANYERAWADLESVYALGRYSKLKLLEYATRVGYPLELPDLRAKGGWSPREGLALLFPTYETELMGADEPRNIRIAEMLAGVAQRKLATLDVHLNKYVLQVCLCDFKQEWVGQRQFPGRSLDSELEYDAKIRPHWDWATAMYATRRILFPERALGEVAGWDYVRKELGTVARRHRYTWSDLRFDFLASKDHLGEPVPWAP